MKYLQCSADSCRKPCGGICGARFIIAAKHSLPILEVNVFINYEHCSYSPFQSLANSMTTLIWPTLQHSKKMFKHYLFDTFCCSGNPAKRNFTRSAIGLTNVNGMGRQVKPVASRVNAVCIVAPRSSQVRVRTRSTQSRKSRGLINKRKCVTSSVNMAEYNI